MEINSPTLFLEINNSEYIFTVKDKDEDGKFKILYENQILNHGISEFRISDFNLAYSIIKKNIYLIEQEINFIFKDIILILNNFNFTFINLTGFKKLNGSQILKENITYILNSLKSNIDEFEEHKKLLHIFNSKYYLDKKKIENLPIGLFGDFYSHEISCCLMNNNDYKNLNNIFNKCNLKIKKILLKSFVEGSHISNVNMNLDTFFQIEIGSKTSKIFYFADDALIFEQNFNFGSNIILNDILKVTSLNENTIKEILINTNFNETILEEDLVEEKFFKGENYRKIKKQLILEIASVRIKELADIIIVKNINLISFQKKDIKIFLNISDKLHFELLKNIFSSSFSKNSFFSLELSEKVSTEDLIFNSYNLVHFGWKKEAIPVIHIKKSLIARFFNTLFD
jgi:cell division protein FtsA